MNISSNQFGLIVAYLLPGFIGLFGLAPFVPTVAIWLRPTSYAEASLGPPMYVLLLATAIGMILSCFRWLIIDQLHRWTGVPSPKWDDGRLSERLEAFNYLVESHYRYYQFVGNTIIAIVIAYPIQRWFATSPVLGLGTDAATVVVCLVLLAASRDALAKYYARTHRLIGHK